MVCKCMTVTHWTSNKESTSDCWNINLVLAKFINLLTPPTNHTGWHSTWSPGQTHTGRQDIKSSLASWIWGQRQPMEKSEHSYALIQLSAEKISLNFVTAEASRINTSSCLHPGLPGGIFRFPHQNPVWISLLHHTFHLAHPFHNLWFDHPYIT